MRTGGSFLPARWIPALMRRDNGPSRTSRRASRERRRTSAGVEPVALLNASWKLAGLLYPALSATDSTHTFDATSSPTAHPTFARLWYSLSEMPYNFLKLSASVVLAVPSLEQRR